MTIATFPADWQRHAISGASANQFGTIPYRIEAAGPLFLAVTSRRTGRWIFPKGNLMTGLSPSASAQEEAFEEAGVRGTIETTPLGAYGTLKQRPEQTTLINVFAFALRVEEVHEDWPEKHQRTRRWMNAQELAAVLSDPGAVALTIKLAERLASPPPLATADR